MQASPLSCCQPVLTKTGSTLMQLYEQQEVDQKWGEGKNKQAMSPQIAAKRKEQNVSILDEEFRDTEEGDNCYSDNLAARERASHYSNRYEYLHEDSKIRRRVSEIIQKREDMVCQQNMVNPKINKNTDQLALKHKDRNQSKLQ